MLQSCFPARCLLLASLVAMLLGCGGESAPRPSHAQAALGAKEGIDAAAEQMTSDPRSAASRLSLLMESLEGYARDYGGPFENLLETARDIQTKLGDKPTKEQVQSQMGRLQSQVTDIIKAG